MHWRSKRTEHGFQRIVRRFAFLPIRVDEPYDMVVWLSWVWLEQEYEMLKRQKSDFYDFFWMTNGTYATRPKSRALAGLQGASLGV